MKGMVLEKNSPVDQNPLSLKQVKMPDPGPGELLIKLKACGVCHTDLHIVEGDIPLKKLPVIPGHEVIGIIEKPGGGVKNFREGDRVGIPWLYSTCGACEFCTGGKENLCENARFTGWHVNGGYADFTIGLENFTYKIPEEFDDNHAAPLMCAGVVGFRALRSSEIRPAQKLGLFGFGASAHVIIQIAVHWGCKVYVFTRSQKHQKHAETLGAVWVGSPRDNPPEKLDSAIIFAPAGEIVARALEVIKKGGVVANSSIYSSDIPKLNYERHLYFEKKLKNVANSTRQDVTDCLSECAKAKVKTDIEVFPWTKANKVLQLVKESKISGAGVLTFG